MTVILVTGSNGQIGAELSDALAAQYGPDKIITSDVGEAKAEHHFYRHEVLDITNAGNLRDVLDKHCVTQIYHLGGLLSCVAEEQLLKAWHINMTGLLNVLEASATKNIERIFWPSSIAVFGPNTPDVRAEQHTLAEPNTIYGIIKGAGEGMCDWYCENRGLDIRILRFPGLISYKAAPGGGATDWAVEMLQKAVSGDLYKCNVSETEALPMMYMPDAIRATMELMHAPVDKIHGRRGYNLAGFSASPQDLAEDIRKQGVNVQMDYDLDGQQEIASSWPNSIDDDPARCDWGWRPEFDLSATTKDMLFHLREEAVTN